MIRASKSALESDSESESESESESKATLQAETEIEKPEPTQSALGDSLADFSIWLSTKTSTTSVTRNLSCHGLLQLAG